MKIVFVTGNNSKFNDVKRYINQLDPSIELIMEDLDIIEPQSLEIEKVAKAKAKCAWEILKKPLIIDDGGIYLEKYNKFPGTLSKYVAEGIGLEGVWKLAENDPRTYFLCCIVYVDGPESIHYFSGISYGKMIKPNGYIRNPQFPYTEIFVPDGSDKSYAELRERGEADQYSHRRKAIVNLIEFLKQK